jgi:hypothetical protein
MVVLVVSWRRSERSSNARSTRQRLLAALTDVTIFELPFVVSVTAWLVASYVITGSPLEQFTSIYGNATQEKFLAHKTLPDRLLYVVDAIWYLAPALVIVCLIALVVAWVKRDLGVFAPIAIVGGGLAFDMVSYVGNSIQPFLRYFITAVPLVVLVLGFLLQRPGTTREGQVEERPVSGSSLGTRSGPSLGMGIAQVVAILLVMIPSVALTWRAVQNPAIGLEESEFLGLVLNHRLSNADSGIRQEYPEEIRLAAYLEKLHLRDGSVVVDNASSCVPGIITTIDNPKVFVIPNDRSYQRTLADPLTFRAHYILEADPLGTNSVTSINIAYPTLWSTGAGFARSVHTFRFTGQCRDFRLFKVFTHPTEAQTNAGTQA